MKKIISLVLCISIISAVFISCKNNTSTSTDTANDILVYDTYDSAYYFDESAIRAYQDLCKAVVNGEDTIRLNAGFFDSALELFYSSFPLSVLVDDINKVDSEYVINYNNDEQTHKAKVDEFIEKIYQIKTECNDANDTAYAIKLYNKIAASIKISDNPSINCYETVVNGEGSAFSYSKMFEYLLQQRGINSYHILCEDKGGNSKSISAAELGGKLYYFDLFSEYNDNKGTLLKYFGMTTSDAENIGLQNFIYTNREVADDASDLRFQACRFCKSWEIDDTNLLVTRNDEEIVQIAL